MTSSSFHPPLRSHCQVPDSGKTAGWVPASSLSHRADGRLTRYILRYGDRQSGKWQGTGIGNGHFRHHSSSHKVQAEGQICIENPIQRKPTPPRPIQQSIFRPKFVCCLGQYCMHKFPLPIVQITCLVSRKETVLCKRDSVCGTKILYFRP